MYSVCETDYEVHEKGLAMGGKGGGGCFAHSFDGTETRCIL